MSDLVVSGRSPSGADAGKIARVSRLPHTILAEPAIIRYLGACFWALWAAAALAVATTVMKRISALRAKRQKKPEPPPAERNQPQSIPEQQKAVDVLKGERTRRSQRWIFTIERITDEKKS